MKQADARDFAPASQAHKAHPAFALIDAAFDRAISRVRPRPLSSSATSLVVDIIFILKLARDEQIVIQTLRAALSSLARTHDT
jgi:hypothetical protein